jgi:sensor histidine kinase YesM
MPQGSSGKYARSFHQRRRKSMAAHSVPRWAWRSLFGVLLVTTGGAIWAANAFVDFSFVEVWTTLNLFCIALGVVLAPILLGVERLRGLLIWLVPGAMLMIVLTTFAVFAVLDRFYGTGSSQINYTRLLWTLFGGISAGGLYAGILALWVARRNRELARTNKQLVSEKRESELSRQLSETKLRMLQAQIEPHFLFNTLAAAQQLSEKGAPNAAKLIGHLIRFLRLAIPSMREQTATVARECEFVSAYLAIMQTRMGKRLTYVVDVAPSVEAVPIPPAMVMTLVENAIKHGLEPSLDGGEVRIVAEDDGETVRLTVADTGVGLVSAAEKETGSGLGLSNIGERLQAIYAGKARMELGENAPRGFKAVLHLPKVMPMTQDGKE